MSIEIINEDCLIGLKKINKVCVDLTWTSPPYYNAKSYSKWTTYQDYLDAVQKTSTAMFWYIPPDVIPLDSFDFTYQVPKWDHDYVHVFKNDDEFNALPSDTIFIGPDGKKRIKP